MAGFEGLKHSDETRRKMSEAAKRRRERENQEDCITCYRKLVAAIVNQAVKDGATWFFESETGRDYCASAGIDPAQGARQAFLNAPRSNGTVYSFRRS